MDETYRFDERSYDALDAAGVGWQAALQVLRAPRRVRQHIGAVLRVASVTADGRWVAVVLIEEDPDQYLVVSARELQRDEARQIADVLERGEA
ncbi:hypothetical protein [Cryptosporangium arvum]|uniref:hypothetical protein n=1 Tax=Cryptosporangium arvum TaxID=80871 RepID=UPI0004AE5946|nr:hypothetical protein [Cryptosporangium arvum]